MSFRRTTLAIFCLASGCAPQDVTLVAPRKDAGADASLQACSPLSKPQRGAFAYGEALQKSLFFLDAQRVGRLPPDNRVAWRGDSLLRDGEDVSRDLSGGWQAGSNATKNTTVTAYTVAMLSWGLLEAGGAFGAACQKNAALSNLRWGVDDLIRAFTQDGPTRYELFAGVGRQAEESTLWVPPEVRDQLSLRPSFKVDDKVPGPDIAGHVSAAFAAASMVFRSAGDVVFANTLLTKAERAFTFGDNFRENLLNPDLDGTTVKDAQGRISHDVPYRSLAADKLLWAAAWLHKAHHDQAGYDGRYARSANAYFDELKNHEATPLIHWKDHSVFLANKGACLLLAQTTHEQRFVDVVQNYIDWWTIGFVDRVTYTPGGLPWRQPSKPFASALNAAFLASVYARWVTSGVCESTNAKTSTHSGGKCAQVADAFAVTVANYLLGQNPSRRSYMVGFGSNPVLRPHHAAAMGAYAGALHFADPKHFFPRWRHTLYGAVVGGPNAQDEWAEAAVGQMPSVIEAEPALEFSAAVPGLMAMLFESWGGPALADVFAPAVPGPEEVQVFAEAALSLDGSLVHIWINNRSSWPPVVLDRLSVRYFITLEPGVSLTDVEVSLVRSDCLQAKPPRLIAWRDRLAYIDIDCTGTPVFPGGVDGAGGERFRKHIEMRVTAPVWDPSNDPSFDVGLVGAGEPGRMTDRVVVYDQQQRVFGRVP
ncbi:MAG: glycoside hydrolase family 9 protein [Deltaproteobacteria bacterium]|nr:glycoside hydrolase family 9 protein [Deltaproteobacteria bacterium]